MLLPEEGSEISSTHFFIKGPSILHSLMQGIIIVLKCPNPKLEVRQYSAILLYFLLSLDHNKAFKSKSFKDIIANVLRHVLSRAYVNTMRNYFINKDI